MSWCTTAIARRRLSCVTSRDVLLVDHHLTPLGIVQPLQQRQHGRFPRAGSPHQPDLLAGWDMQGEVLQHALAIRIAEAYDPETKASRRAGSAVVPRVHSPSRAGRRAI